MKFALAVALASFLATQGLAVPAGNAEVSISPCHSRKYTHTKWIT